MKVVRVTFVVVMVLLGCAAVGLFLLLGVIVGGFLGVGGFPGVDKSQAYRNDAIYLTVAAGAFSLAWLALPRRAHSVRNRLHPE